MAEKKFKRTTVTSALPYANGGVHIGHLAGVYVPADIYVRYLRLKKEDVMFIGGSDEHGVPITVRARKEGITPQDVVDRYHKMIKKTLSKSLVSRLTSIVVPPQRHTISLLRSGSRNSTTKVSWWRRLLPSFTTRKLSSSWQTAMWWASVLIAIMRAHTVTSVRSADAT